jgi:hypothetical protein
VLTELGLNPDEIRELPNVPVAWLLAANATVGTKITLRHDAKLDDDRWPDPA